jgi:sugar lactone lactonase YvrE
MEGQMRTPTLVLVTAAALAAALAACSDDSGSPAADGALAPAPVELASRHLGSGRSETILPLTGLTDMPEGIAVNDQGEIFLGNRRLDGEQRIGEVLRITPDHRVSVFATLGRSGPGFNEGLAGLAVDAQGDLYAAFISHDPATQGVYRIGRRGGVARLPGSEAMLLPDALAFDARGNLYVSDAEDGAIWRFPRAGRGVRWLRHPLLAPREIGIGANGVAFVPPATLYVAVTEQNHIVRIPILNDGSPGGASVAAAGGPLQIIDGLAADVHGNLYAAVVGFSIVGTNPVVRVDPRTGAMTPMAGDPGAFDWPTSLAFGRGPLDHKGLYVVNSGIFPDGRPDAAPGVVRLGIGVAGAPNH